MPRTVNPNAVDHSLPGRLKQLGKVVKDLGSASHSTIFSMLIGAGGLIVNGATQLVGGITGPLAVTGSISATTTVSAVVLAGTNAQISDVFAANAPTNVFTGPRVAGWWLNANGQGGTATSSKRFKTNVMPIDGDALATAFLQISVSYFEYINEVRKRDDPTYSDYVGPDYHVPTNIGVIAEQLHELGLWEFVVYERNTDDSLVLDKSGEPIPFAVHDTLMGYGLLAIAQQQKARSDRFAARLHALDGLDEN